MIQEDEKLQKSRLRGANIITIFSIYLVLFVMGVQLHLLSYTNKLSSYVKEKLCLSVVVKDKVRESDILDLKETIESHTYTKEVRYISPSDAAAELQASLGEDFIDFLGYNPILPLLEVNFKADYLHSDSIQAFCSTIERYHIVKETYYQRDLIDIVNENTQKINSYLAIFCAVLLIISILLINNTMRLLIYSKRFAINTMQLVGASASFIRRPFIWRSCLYAIIAGFFSSASLLAIMYFIRKKLPQFIGKDDFKLLAMICLAIVLVGVIIAIVSAYFSVNKYIKMRNSEKIYN